MPSDDDPPPAKKRKKDNVAVLAVATKAKINNAAQYFHVENEEEGGGGEEVCGAEATGQQRSFQLSAGAATLLQGVMGRFTESLYFSLFRDGVYREGVPVDIGPSEEWPSIVNSEDVAEVAKQVDAVSHAFSVDQS